MTALVLPLVIFLLIIVLVSRHREAVTSAAVGCFACFLACLGLGRSRHPYHDISRLSTASTAPPITNSAALGFLYGQAVPAGAAGGGFSSSQEQHAPTAPATDVKSYQAV